MPVDFDADCVGVMRFYPNEIDLPWTSGGCWRLIRRGTRSDDFSFPPRRERWERSPNARGPAVDGAPAARTISPWLSWGDPRWRLLRCALCDRGVDDDGGGVSLRAEETGWPHIPRTAVDSKKKSTLAGIYCE